MCLVPNCFQANFGCILFPVPIPVPRSKLYIVPGNNDSVEAKLNPRLHRNSDTC